MRSMYGELAVFSGRANQALAEEICRYLGVPLRGADVFQFPNENIFVRLHGSVRSQDVFLIQPTCCPVNTNIMELLIFIDCLRRDSAGRITAVVPYYAYGRTDKKDQPRVPITARLVADLITVAGADRFLTIDLHAGQIQGFFTIPVDDITAFHMLSDYFIQKGVEDAVVIAPDVGASKKARNFAQELGVPLAIVEKRRVLDGSKTRALNLIGEVRGRNAIIFDDEIDTAGTVMEAAHFLKDQGAGDIYVCATHPVFSDPAVERLRAAGLKEIVVTNTIPIPPEKMLPHMTVLSVGPLLGEVIRRIHQGVSVGEMFNE
ncbi:MAG: ribose-phosphate diphosphokinase [Anaerolineae bacterium]